MIEKTILLTHENTARKYYYGDRAIAGLRAIGNLLLNDSEEILSPDDFVRTAIDCSVIVLDRQTPIGSYEIDQLPNLKAIVRSGVDARHIDVEAASRAGVLVTRTNAGYVASTAELILCHILTCSRSVPKYINAFRKGESIEPIMGQELSGSTVGLIGYGRIGQHLAGVLVAMGVNVLIYDPYSKAKSPAKNVELDYLFEVADYIVPVVTVTPETINLVDSAAFDRMKATAWFVNCSRGEIVDETALEEALDSGKIAGASLDVGRDADQLPPKRFAGRDNVQATPHIGNLTRQAAERQPLETVEQVADILMGVMPQTAINPEHATRFSGRANKA